MYPNSRRSRLLSLVFALGVFVSCENRMHAMESSGDAIAVEPSPASSAPTVPDAKSRRAENSVVQVFSTVLLPDFGKPWAKQAPKEVTGSGVVIEGKRILTTAHVVLYAGQIQVQAYQSGDKVSARIETIAPGIDLAVLKIEDESFFEMRTPLPRSTALPTTKDAVIVYGYPTGGTSLSTTKGIVSRIEYARYNYPAAGLRIQIDAAINPGNSGGPALVDDRMIGLAYSRLGGAQNIGYIIPCEEIELFLHDITDGRYHGKAAVFGETSSLENAALRSYLQLDTKTEGAVIHSCEPADPAFPLKKWDVITKIGDTPVDNEGKIRLGNGLHVSLDYLVQKLVKSGEVPLTVVRGGKELAIQVPVEYERPKLIPNLNGTYPAYFIYGPIVFSVATEDFIAAITAGTTSQRGSTGISGAAVFNALSMSDSPLVTRRSERPTAEEKELVVIPAPFFPHKLAKGYRSPAGRVVKSVNGISVKSLRHLVGILRDAKEDFIVIELAGRSTDSLVFPRKEMVAATEEILSDNGIRTQGSPDTLEVWNAK